MADVPQLQTIVAPAFVQQVVSTTATAGVVTLTLPNVKPRDSILVLPCWYGSAPSGPPTDNNGQTYNQILANVVTGSLGMGAYWLPSSNGGNVVISIPLNTTYPMAIALEYSPVTSILSLSSIQSTTNFTIGPLTTPLPNQTLLAACNSANAGATITPSAPQTLRASAVIAAHLFAPAADQPGPTPGSYSANFTQGTAYAIVGVLFALQGPVVAGPLTAIENTKGSSPAIIPPRPSGSRRSLIPIFKGAGVI